MTRYRSVVVEEGGRLNNYAIEPEMYVDSTQRTGFTEYAEKLNGRLAMVGFLALIAVEVVSKSTLIDLVVSLGR
ncbi:MAG: chlorophyll a/b-binding protein [Cyanobacteriota bacterium]|nr:chlorophyll a/b-binding protein [Cyanobacteriota bacterium]